MSKKMRLHFDEEAVAVLNRLGSAAGSTHARVIRDALVYYEFFRKVVLEEGSDVVLVKDGKLRERVTFNFTSES